MYLILLYRCLVLLFYGVLRLFYSLFAEKLFQRTCAEYMLFTLVVGYFAYAQYDVLFLLVFARKRSDEANSREGVFPQGIYFITLVVGYFANAQYDVFFLHVILSMSSEQTCLQGFANEDIHKAQAFCKNAKR